MESKFDIVLGIDMETDVGSFTDMYEGVQHGTYRLLDIMEKNGAKATYFWTGHAATNNKSVVKSVVEAGHEIGCHSLVHETLGDAIFPLPNNWPVCDFEVEGRIKEATRQVTEASGVKPSSFRCPRLWGSTKVVQVLESLGFKADASLPLYFYRNNIKPYHPAYEDWTKEGDLKIVEIPNFCDLAMESNDPYQRDRDQWPLFRTKGADYMIGRSASFVDYVSQRGVRPVLCFYLHPWEFHPMPRGPIDYGEASVKPLDFITLNCGDVACKELDNMLAGLVKMGGTFKTAAMVAAEY
ncbi:MAG: polysaccharide deacetylase family protein [Victivallales bacterium]|nr:polysaccharide deacetylase family protein [Victivallales bacterium]